MIQCIFNDSLHADIYTTRNSWHNLPWSDIYAFHAPCGNNCIYSISYKTRADTKAIIQSLLIYSAKCKRETRRYITSMYELYYILYFIFLFQLDYYPKGLPVGGSFRVLDRFMFYQSRQTILYCILQICKTILGRACYGIEVLGFLSFVVC